MRILYLSVHQVLEYDEIRVFRQLGHEVFSVGTYFSPEPTFPLRPYLNLGESHGELRRCFEAMGCISDGMLASCHLTVEFVSLFDVVVVMHDIHTVARLWPALSVRPVIWRTIGQGIDLYEDVAKPFRTSGMFIVRYSPNEMLSDAYIGADALIRFAKDTADFAPWEGHENRVVSFVNMYAQRYPEEYARYGRITNGLPHALGGLHNEDLPGAIGAVDSKKQLAVLRDSRAYLYASGGGVPYTLTFIEAWMAGIPLVVMDNRSARSRFDEIPLLIRDMETGVVARSESEARSALQALLADDALARRIGTAGREAAEALFGWNVVGKQWDALFAMAVGRPS